MVNYTRNKHLSKSKWGIQERSLYFKQKLWARSVERVRFLSLVQLRHYFIEASRLLNGTVKLFNYFYILNIKYWNTPTNQFRVSFLLHIHFIKKTFISRAVFSSAFANVELLKTSKERWNCHTFLQPLWSFGAWREIPECIKQELKDNEPYPVLRVPTHSRLVQAAFWQAQQMSGKTQEETEATVVEERGRKHTNPSKALFCYLGGQLSF